MSKMRSEDYHEGYWERGEGSNYHNYGDDPGWNITARVVASQLFRGARVFEVACAKGYFVQAAVNHNLDCYGIDISEYAVNAAPVVIRPRLSVGNAAVWQDMIDAFPANVDWVIFGANCVISNEFLEHVYEDEVDTVLDNMQDLLAEDGLFIARIGLDMETGQDYAHQDDDCTHVCVKPRRWWEQKFTDRGWRRLPFIESEFDDAFRGRDWAGRFFAYQI